jgi:hypothetical protein
MPAEAAFFARAVNAVNFDDASFKAGSGIGEARK